jgi:hypothetical protein
LFCFASCKQHHETKDKIVYKTVVMIHCLGVNISIRGKVVDQKKFGMQQIIQDCGDLKYKTHSKENI